MSEIDESPELAPVSKTRKKQEMQDLQELGKELVKLPESRLAKLTLPEGLRAAVTECRRITKHEALRRQLQYIGRLMRGVDPAPIQAQMNQWRGQSSQATALMHKIERWRDRLIAEEGALTEFLRDVPGIDASEARQLVRNARREAVENKPPKSSRALFRMIRDALEPAEQADDQES
jgi:ribosome-associated protein